MNIIPMWNYFFRRWITLMRIHEFETWPKTMTIKPSRGLSFRVPYFPSGENSSTMRVEALPEVRGAPKTPELLEMISPSNCMPSDGAGDLGFLGLDDLELRAPEYLAGGVKRSGDHGRQQLHGAHGFDDHNVDHAIVHAAVGETG